MPSERDVDFNGNVIFRVGPQRGDLTPNHTLDGIHGLATNGRIPSPGGVGVVGFGGPNKGTGVLGLGSASGGGSGGTGSGGTGVQGIGGDGLGFGFEGPVNPGIGVLGTGGKPDPFAQPPMPGGVGVLGVAGGPADGVVGVCDSNDKSGVFGFNSRRDGAAFGVVGRCDSSNGVGVAGDNAQGDGVRGISRGRGRGVYGESASGVGVMGLNRTRKGLAGFFQGRVTVVGDFAVFGAKSAAVPHPDGSHRLLYSMESPESWFEDFGEATLVNGEAIVQLDHGFASVVVNTDSYHVFLSPYGDSNGLFVSRRNETEFEVREQRGGKSNLSFSYRIAAKRRDIGAERLAKVALPEGEFSESPQPPVPSSQ